MELEKILSDLDKLFQENKINMVEDFLNENIKNAITSGEYNIAVSLLNELMGFFRETGQREKSYECIDTVVMLMESLNLKDTVYYGTTMINAANAYRAGGDFNRSLNAYNEAERIYKKYYSSDNNEFAAFYNNLSLLYQEMGDFNLAKDALIKSLNIILKQDDSKLEQGVTHTNLASTYIALKEYDKAEKHLKEALRLFNEENIKDIHYCGALSSYGSLLYMTGRYTEAAELFLKAADRIKTVIGDNTEQYRRIMDNYKASADACKLQNNIKGLLLCRKYYEEYGKPMIEEKFPEYKDRIAVGLAGEGSDCFGFDDEYSRDHDWGPGFSMWLTEEDYSAIGESLEEEYGKLPKEYMGFKRLNTGRGQKRTGVNTIKGFFTGLLGDNIIPENIFEEEDKCSSDEIYNNINWLDADEYRLAAAVNGEVFCDKLGIFTEIRRILKKYYPKNIIYLVLAEHAALFAQSGQYNFARMLKRHDYAAALMEASKGVRECLRIINVLNKTYSCHDKWLLKGTNFEGGFENAEEILEKISKNAVNTANEDFFETIAGILAKQMYIRNYISDEDTFLENHVNELLTKSRLWTKSKKELIDDIVTCEFDAFDKVKNKGGRAECQDDFNTFSLMRKSQYLVWDKEMLIQYLYEFRLNMKEGRNMIEEKYGRMMEYTAPLEYEEIKDRFAYIPAEKQQIIDTITSIQRSMMMEFAEKYPKLAKNARSVSSADDNLYNTSSETYLKGEISTYSDKMLELYGRFVAECLSQGRNISYETIENTVRLYGYKSLEDAEGRI